VKYLKPEFTQPDRYGGPWTNIKADVLRSYLGFFTTAFKNQGFELWYIDGFAGTG